MRIETPEQLARKMAEKGIGIDRVYEERTGCPWDYGINERISKMY